MLVRNKKYQRLQEIDIVATETTVYAASLKAENSPDVCQLGHTHVNSFHDNRVILLVVIVKVIN